MVKHDWKTISLIELDKFLHKVNRQLIEIRTMGGNPASEKEVVELLAEIRHEIAERARES